AAAVLVRRNQSPCALLGRPCLLRELVSQGESLPAEPSSGVRGAQEVRSSRTPGAPWYALASRLADGTVIVQHLFYAPEPEPKVRITTGAAFLEWTWPELCHQMRIRRAIIFPGDVVAQQTETIVSRLGDQTQGIWQDEIGNADQLHRRRYELTI